LPKKEATTGSNDPHDIWWQRTCPFPESDHLFKWVGAIRGAAGTVCEDLRMSSPYSSPVSILNTHWQWSSSCPATIPAWTPRVTSWTSLRTIKCQDHPALHPEPARRTPYW
jgi:hypothetical protein